MSGRPRRHVPARVRAAFGRRLRALREARELSQARLGQGARLSAKFIGELERGAKSPTLDSLVDLARALGVRPEDIVRNLDGRRR